MSLKERVMSHIVPVTPRSVKHAWNYLSRSVPGADEWTERRSYSNGRLNGGGQTVQRGPGGEVAGIRTQTDSVRRTSLYLRTAHTEGLRPDFYQVTLHEPINKRAGHGPAKASVTVLVPGQTQTLYQLGGENPDRMSLQTALDIRRAMATITRER